VTANPFVDVVPARVVDVAHDVDPAARHPDWQPVDLGVLLRGEQLDPAPTILRRTDAEALLYPGRVHLVYGEPESAKGWLVLAACMEQMELGQSVVYIDFEDSAGTAIARLQSLGASHEQIGNLFTYIRPDTPATAEVVASIPGIGAALVVIDGVTEAMTMHGLELKDNADVAKFVELLPRPLAKMGAAVVLVDHVAKDANGRGRFAIGAQHKLAGIDGAAYSLEVVKPFGRGLSGISRLTVTKDRPGFVRPVSVYGKRTGDVHLTSGDGGAVVVRIEPAADVTGDAFRPTFLMERVSRFLETLTEPASQTVIERKVEGKIESVRRALDVLVTEGFVERTPGPRNSLNHALTRPFREAGS
jgi:AAA domain